MVVLTVTVHFDFPEVFGLKGRRKILKSIQDRLKNRNYSTIDLSGEYPKEGVLGLASVCLSQQLAHQKLISLQEFLDHQAHEYDYQIDSEIL